MNLRKLLGIVKLTVDGNTHYFWRWGRYRKLFDYLFKTYGSSTPTRHLRATEIICDSTKRAIEARAVRAFEPEATRPTNEHQERLP